MMIYVFFCPVSDNQTVIHLGCGNMEAQQIYKIRLKGHLGDEWSEWFDGFTITNLDNGDTILSGLIHDQSALFSILIKIIELGIPLLELRQVKSGEIGTGGGLDTA